MIETARLTLRALEPGDLAPLYFLHRGHWGRGYATEVVRASLAHGFDTLALAAIGAFAKPENGASVRVLEKCGFAFLRYEPPLERNHYEIRPSVTP